MIQLENDFVNIVLNYFYYYIAFWNVSHRLTIAERATLELAGEIGNAAAPTVFVGEVVHHLGHGHASTDDVGLDLIAIGFRFSHIQTFLLFFRCALW